MSKIHLILDYKQDQNKYLILFVDNITDYAYKSKEFLQLCKNVREVFYKDESITPENVCQILLNDIYNVFSEKDVQVTYAVYFSMNDLVIYRHRYHHGKLNNFICEKAMFLEVEDKSALSHDDILNIASVMLPAKFKIKKDDKNADSILLSNSDNIFYDPQFLESKAFANFKKLQDRAVADVESRFNVKILNIFCVE